VIAASSATTGAYRECVPFESSTGTSRPPSNAPCEQPGQREPAPDEALHCPAERREQNQAERNPVDRSHERFRLDAMDGRELQEFIDSYNAAWNAHDVEAIVSMHTEDSVFENHVTGDVNVGREAIGKAISGIFSVFPDLAFETRAPTCARTWSSRSGRPRARTRAR
jgi:hypothetical protein